MAVEAVSEGRNCEEVCHGEDTGKLEKYGQTGGHDSPQSAVPTLPLISTDAFICPHCPAVAPSIILHPQLPT